MAKRDTIQASEPETRRPDMGMEPTPLCCPKIVRILKPDFDSTAFPIY